MVPPRKRKLIQTCPVTTTLSIGNCVVEFPNDVEQDYSPNTLSLQVHKSASIRISVDSSKHQPSGILSHSSPGPGSRMGISFQLINPKSLDKVNDELLEGVTQLYKRELPAMSYAAGTGKESNFLENCTTSGKYCTLLMKKTGASLADPEVVVGAITYQILPSSTNYVEIPLAAVDQACQRQGLGQLLVGELARRLTDVGVLTLFCWGDQESEQFWNKQGFLKIAEVDAQGRPQKLRLKNEIRKAMSFPGNSALMVCHLTRVNSPSPLTCAGETTPLRDSASVRAAVQTPIAYSDVSDPCPSPHGSTPCEARPSDASQDQAVTSTCSPIRNNASLKGNLNNRASHRKVTVVTNSTPGSEPSSVRSNRTLKFSRPEKDVSLEKEPSECALRTSSVDFDGTSEGEKIPPTSSPADATCVEKSSSSSEVVSHCSSASRVPLKNLNIAPVKKRPWKSTQCVDLNVVSEHPGSRLSSSINCGPEKENNQPAVEEVSETERGRDDITLNAGLKRPRQDTFPVKTVGRRSVRRRRGESPSSVLSILQASEPSLVEPTRNLEHLCDVQKAKPTVPTIRESKIMDCKQSMADESFSPSGVGDEHLDPRFDKQGKDSTIRKRLTNRLIHVPDVREDLASPAKTCTPVVFLMTMPNDPKKRALAQLVEKLGGRVTGDGGECTHIVTCEARRTLNFCSAICNGAWVVTPDWLKASSRLKYFADEKSYILRDKQFESKYKVSIATVIQLAQRRPCSLFTGFSLYPTSHVQPPLGTITKLIQASGGKILSSLDQAMQERNASHSIVLSGEADKAEADIASRAGLRTFTGEWFMQAIVRQRIDFDAKVLDDH